MANGIQNVSRVPNRLYKYVTGEVLEIILATRKLRWSSPAVFDDPFDVPSQWNIERGFSEVQREMGILLAELVEQGFDHQRRHEFRPEVLNFVYRHVLLPQTERSNTSRELRTFDWQPPNELRQNFDLLRSDMEILRSSLRILCLSEVRDSELMWAMYADTNKGAVIAFEKIDSPSSIVEAALQVEYKDGSELRSEKFWARQSLIDQSAAKDNLIAEFILSKKPTWSVQKEWRAARVVSENEQARVDVSFNPFEIREIYLGVQMESSRKSLVTRLLSHGLGHVQLMQTILNRQLSRLEFEPVS